MASPKFVFYLICLFFRKVVISAQMTYLPSSFRQASDFVSANVGDSVTLQCFFDGEEVARYYWYKQTLGQTNRKPRLVSRSYKFDKNGTFHDEFRNNPRFTLDTGNGKNHLKISNLQISDSATYYCLRSFSVTSEFIEATTLSVKGSDSNIQTLVHQSASESIRPEGSVTLNCTVHTGSCDGGHRVYWFKQSEEPHPGLIYTHEDGNDQCERKPDTQTHTCVYNLPMENLNLSHAGTYYCAVASCGHILFGNGTKVDFEEEEFSPVSLYLWHGAFVFNTILSVLLAFFVCLMNNRGSTLCAESQERFSDSSKTKNVKGYQNEDNAYYIALRAININRPRRQRDETWSECVYFRVKL